MVRKPISGDIYQLKHHNSQILLPKCITTKVQRLVRQDEKRQVVRMDNHL